MTKEITIGGKQYPVTFDMQTILNYEEIVGASFFGATFDKLKERIALVISAILSANKDADVDYSTLISGGSMQAVQQILAAYAVVMDMAGEFFKMPEVEPKDEKPAEDSEKN